MLKEKYGDWALITGASSGIGKSFSYRLASEGINLVIVARRIDKLTAMAKKLGELYKVTVIPVELDLSTENFLIELEKRTNSIEIGILINNAGAGLNGIFYKNTPEECKKIIDLNCTAPVLLTNYFLNKMVVKKRGAVIFISSTVGINPSPFMSVYSATKSFDYFLGCSLWYELKDNNIDVLTVAPGSTNSEFPRLNKSGKFVADPDKVVTTAFNSLGKKVYVVDGIVNKLYTQFFRFLPRRFLLNISGRFAEKLLRKYHS